MVLLINLNRTHYMNKQISSRKQLEAILGELLTIYKPRPSLLTWAAEAYLLWIFGLFASFVIYYFNIRGWGLTFLVYVFVFETLNLGYMWGSALYTKYEKYEHLKIYRYLQIVVILLAVLLACQFFFVWKIYIQVWCFAVVWLVHLYFKRKNPKLEGIPNLPLLPYVHRPDGRILFQIFFAYRVSKLNKNERKMLHEDLYQERFYNLGLDSLGRFYAHPEEEPTIIKEMVDKYLSLMDEFTQNK